jgi:splicing factor 3A subunit 1
MVMDPISGRLVDAKDLSEHMRVQLLDPKWREQQARALEKQKDTPFAAGESIANSLQAFARKRTDIFGSAEEEEARLAREAELRRKTLEQDNQSRWDGMDSPPGNGAPPISQSFSANALPPPPAAPVAPPAAAAPVPPPLPPLPPPPPSFLPPHASGAIPPSASIPAATAAPPQPPPAFEEVQQTPEEWAALNPGPIYLTVNCADDSSVVEAWGLKGQSLTVELPGAMSLVKDLKIKLQEMLGGMPPNKQMLKASVGFLKDSQSLAFYQLATGATIDLLPRKRGGK